MNTLSIPGKRPGVLPVMATALLLVTLTGCAGMSEREKSTAIGAGVGAIGGSVITGGGTLGTVGGAAIGGAVGYELEKRKERR